MTRFTLLETPPPVCLSLPRSACPTIGLAGCLRHAPTDRTPCPPNETVELTHMMQCAVRPLLALFLQHLSTSNTLQQGPFH